MDPNKKRNRTAATGIIVYFNSDKTSFQICKPKMSGDNSFEGNWTALAAIMAGNNGYHSYEII